MSFPYSILDFVNFKSITTYESGLGIGKQVVFYTRQFINTTPGVFQSEKIFPYTVGPLVFVVGIFGFLLIVKSLFETDKNNKLTKFYFFILLAFISYLIPNLFLFANKTNKAKTIVISMNINTQALISNY